MKLTKGTLRRIIKEESRRLTEKEEYKQFFKRALEKAGKSIPQMSDSEKKEFFNKIDAAWNARGEKNESVVSEGKKRFYQQDGIGKAKYTISYHDGKEKHKDGSDFYGIKTFRNKQDLEKFRAELLKKGYREDSGYKKESVNEENINEIGVLGIAGGIALGLAGFLALAKGSYWAKAKLGNTIYNVADKLERRVRRIESEKTQKSIMDIAKKFENDKKLMDMYQSLPKYRSGSKNSVRNKGLREIAKYVKSKLNDEEMQYFYQVNTLLRTGKLESAHDELKTKSINEGKSQDPTLKEMVKFLKSNYRDEEEFSILLAIYFYSEANYGGMRSNLYSALSQLSNKMRVRTKFSDERGTEIEMMVDDLVDEFGGERP